MFLCIDVGNTKTKASVFDSNGNLLENLSTQETGIDALLKFSKKHSIRHAIISTTGKRQWNISEFGIEGHQIELSHETPLPIRIVYSTPETLGRDRIASACGASALQPGKNCLVVDAGTCMTTDILLATGVYLGGNIAPGLMMRLKAMHEYTAKLPLAEPGWPELEIGDSTLHALQNGAGLGMVMEIEGLLRRAKNAFGDVLIVMTGGDADFLAARLENQIFVSPELVMQGLFQILSFNVENYY